MAAEEEKSNELEKKGKLTNARQYRHFGLTVGCLFYLWVFSGLSSVSVGTCIIVFFVD